MMFKAGEYAPNALHDNTDGGMFLGLEWGASPAPPLELGFTLDWYHREHTHGSVVALDGPYDLLVQVVTGEGTSTDLIPIGGVVRIRFPLGRLLPFVAGHFTYDVLHLDAVAVTSPGDVEVALQNTNWFGGFGAGVSVGAELDLAPTFGVVVECGWHESEPTRGFIVNGIPAQARVNADGEYARAGVRFAF
jgi:hypothetical protein